MTGPHPFDSDELASAYLDDEATPDERVTVEADAGLLARVEAFRAVRTELGLDVSLVDAAERESALAAALAVFAARSAAPDEAAAVSPPADFAVAAERAAARRRRPARWWKPVAAVAGAAAIGVAAISGVSNLSASDDDATTAEVPAASEPAPDQADAERATAADEESSGGGAPATIGEIDDAASAEAGPLSESTAAPAEQLPMTSDGSAVIDSTEQLAAYAAELADGLAPSDATTMTETTAAAAQAGTDDAGCPELGVWVATVTWQGEPGELYVATSDSGERVATVAGVDCGALVSVPLP